MLVIFISLGLPSINKKKHWHSNFKLTANKVKVTTLMIITYIIIPNNKIN